MNGAFSTMWHFGLMCFPSYMLILVYVYIYIYNIHSHVMSFHIQGHFVRRQRPLGLHHTRRLWCGGPTKWRLAPALAPAEYGILQSGHGVGQLPCFEKKPRRPEPWCPDHRYHQVPCWHLFHLCHTSVEGNGRGPNLTM